MTQSYIGKKIGMLLVVAGMLTLAFPLVNAYSYSIKHYCENGVCIEGEDATWEVTIYNRGVRLVEFTSIELLEHSNQSVFADVEREFRPQSSDRGDLIVVAPGKSTKVNLSGKTPPANYQNQMLYYPCFTKTVRDSYLVAKVGRYTDRRCYNQNESMPVVQCVLNDDCAADQMCRFNVCWDLNCGSCQFVKNHACVDYGCCSSDQCAFNEVCEEHECRKLNCGVNEYIENRTCRELKCGFDERIVNGTCTALNCSFDEYAFNHTCKKLNCKSDEIVFNNTCKACGANEKAENNKCQPLNCRFNEAAFNHTCRKLDCNAFQKIENHACVLDWSVALKTLFEAAAIIIIAIFLFLDLRKYKSKHSKQEKKENVLNENIYKGDKSKSAEGKNKKEEESKIQGKNKGEKEEKKEGKK